jgi:hypothetical protein
MKIGLLADTSTSIMNRQDDADISPGDRGRRFINSLLYRASKPQELSLALAIFGLLNGGSLFFFSHERRRIKLETACGCFPNVCQSSEQEDNEFIGIDISLAQLRSSTGAESNGEPSSLDNEVDGCIDVCIMNDYWHRAPKFDELSYIQMMEGYYLKAGKGPGELQMMLGHPMPFKHHWIKNPYGKTACGIVYGKGLPNIYDPDTNTETNREYFFKSLLVLFQPHRRPTQLLQDCKFVFFWSIVCNLNSFHNLLVCFLSYISFP